MVASSLMLQQIRVERRGDSKHRTEGRPGSPIGRFARGYRFDPRLRMAPIERRFFQKWLTDGITIAVLPIVEPASERNCQKLFPREYLPGPPRRSPSLAAAPFPHISNLSLNLGVV